MAAFDMARPEGLTPDGYDFDVCLEESDGASDLPFWGNVYRSFFPTMLSETRHSGAMGHQSAGIDRTVFLSDGRAIRVDEKVRWRNRKTGRVYEDVLLEYKDGAALEKPGWVCKPLLCDYIAYAIAPLGRCYLLPVVQLQLAWDRHGNEWISECPRIPSNSFRNGRHWKTLSVGVPYKTLFSAICGCCFCEFDPMETPVASTPVQPPPAVPANNAEPNLFNIGGAS